MPKAFDDRVHQRANELFAQGTNSNIKVKRQLEEEFGLADAPANERTIDRWRKRWKEEQDLEKAAETMGSDAPSTGGQPEPYIQEPDPIRVPKTELAEPPSLRELIEKGVPEDKAPRLLANWDVAYLEGHSLRTKVYETAISIFEEFEKIPYDKAMALAELEAKADEFDIDTARELAQIIRRYRPWEARENHKAFMEFFFRWRDKRLGVRQKKSSKGIMSRLFRKGEETEDPDAYPWAKPGWGESDVAGFVQKKEQDIPDDEEE